jgi:hypothetical protein
MGAIQVNTNPSDKQLRRFAATLPVGAGLIAAVAWWRTGAWPAPAAAWAAATTLAAVGLARPRAVRWVYLALVFLTLPIGWCVSHVLLAAIFFLVVTPIGLAMRVLGRDPMRRRPDRSAESYWIARRRPGGGIDRYLRPY